MSYSNQTQPSATPYAWVLFDADETLFHFDAFAGLKLMFEGFGIDFTQADFDEFQLVNKPLWVDYQDGKITAAELQTIRFTAWSVKLGVTPQSLNSAYLAAMAQICVPLPGVPDLLAALQGKAKLGIITNGFTELQQVRLERTGLKHHFDILVISELVGVAKPDVGIFEHALELMGNPSREKVLMVGDNLHSDIQGGLNAGFHTCWYNVQGHAAPVGIRPHFQVGSHQELQQKLFSML
ncbi:pyrimidine 5'-nucleotidase [Shewanella acanthi]|uniref:pyrimidine 5'-nucleotidase n=1 Tax=Shewanella acanthi TaxID=2864212 RepID=UPI001C65F175|nr:pyrimidine 5'-nucleotidase [Shewanella acanthi]QYJ78570.1 pyrimidine 5'-nucleotidase [Shewanella acanthi]